MPPGSRLRVHRAPERPSAAVLLLHGGRADSLQPVPRLALARLRMHPFAAQIARRPWGRQALVAAVRYRYRGWNGDQAHPVQDALQALDELSALAPGVPVLLVGHSMGARAALAVAGADAVRGVVALAPWCPPGEPVAHLRGRAAVFLHDESDRITSAAQTWDFAHRAAAAGADVRCVPMPNGGHAMIRGARRWHELAADHAGAVLARTPAPHPGGAAPSGRS
nr:alpha/beta fold hydrolase [Kitasatospora sp. MMS16-BH015]